MEQEPVYVLSDKLTRVCQDVLARIYESRTDQRVAYVKARMHEHNGNILRKNKWRKLFWLRPLMFVTPAGMEAIIHDEVMALDIKDRPNHQMLMIHQEYGLLEHQAKDCMIQCSMNETVPVSADMMRGISHLGVEIGSMTARRRIGFHNN